MHQATWPWTVFAIVAVVVLVALVATALLRRAQDRSDYRAVDLLSPAEIEIYRCLTQLYGMSASICPKVRLADLIMPQKGLDRSKFQTAFNRISAKHVDFVILRVEDLVVLGVVELDDRSHSRQDRIDRDGFVDDALRQCGIPVCRVKAKRSYDLNELCAQLNDAFSPPASLKQAQE